MGGRGSGALVLAPQKWSVRMADESRPPARSARSVSMPAKTLPWSDVAAWAAIHGLATLRLEGPPRFWSADQDAAAEARLLDVILAGLTNEPPA